MNASVTRREGCGQQMVDECECTVHRLLEYIRKLTVCVYDMLGVDCADEMWCDEPPARGRVPVPPVVQDCAAPCDVAKKRCHNRPCPSTCKRAIGYFNQKWLPGQPADPRPRGRATELVDLSLVKTDCVFFCCRGPEPATNRCVYRKLPRAPAPARRPLPECCPCLPCNTVAAPGRNRFPLRKGPCEYQWDDDQPCCGKPPGTACDCTTARTLYRDLLVERCTDRLADIVATVTALAEWRARTCCPDRGGGGECPTFVATTAADQTVKCEAPADGPTCKPKVSCALRRALCPKKPRPWRR